MNPKKFLDVRIEADGMTPQEILIYLNNISRNCFTAVYSLPALADEKEIERILTDEFDKRGNYFKVEIPNVAHILFGKVAFPSPKIEKIKNCATCGITDPRATCPGEWSISCGKWRPEPEKCILHPEGGCDCDKPPEKKEDGKVGKPVEHCKCLHNYHDNMLVNHKCPDCLKPIIIGFKPEEKKAEIPIKTE